MSKTRNLSDLLDANGDVKSTALDNVPASNDASALTTGTLDNARLATNVSVSGDLTVDTDTLKVDSTTNRIGIKVANPQHDLEIDGNALLRDSRKLYLGTSGDMAIHHNGTDSYILDQGTGDLYIGGSSNIWLVKGDGTGGMAQFTADGAAKLRYNNTTKFETTSSGASVTGTLTATAFSGDGSALTGINATGVTASSYGSSNKTNGYVRFTDGLIVQWGWVSSSGGWTVKTITLPLTFPNYVYSITTAIDHDTGYRTNVHAMGHIVSTSQIKVGVDDTTTSGAFWMVIGK